MRQSLSSGVFDDVAVCIPTVGARAAYLEETLAEWLRFGVTPLIQLQPDDWPRSAHSHRRNSEVALRRALAERPDARHILYTEDDILLSPELELWLPALKVLNAPATLFVDGLVFYPLVIRRLAHHRMQLPERIVRLRHLEGWWGSQAILIPRSIVEASLLWESEIIGWDIHFKTFLQAHAIPMYIPVPNPVQHRVEAATVAGSHLVGQSITYGRPSDRSGISPAHDMDWCPHGNWDPDPRVS